MVEFRKILQFVIYVKLMSKHKTKGLCHVDENRINPFRDGRHSMNDSHNTYYCVYSYEKTFLLENKFNLKEISKKCFLVTDSKIGMNRCMGIAIEFKGLNYHSLFTDGWLLLQRGHIF